MNWWLVAAYTVFFAGFSGYSFVLSQRQRDLDRRIHDLKNRIDKRQAADP
jgi:CcmD family protein